MKFREVIAVAVLGFIAGRVTAPKNDPSTLAQVAEAAALSDQSKLLLERMGNSLKECAAQNQLLATQQAVATELTHSPNGTD